ncbi:hypothetical protein [Arthrobacter sp. UYEF3]|uniref:hypothetical protein n=1 Tax=Arthrobacter sp. UYEF3 TaxID=1756365 RepID=UPI00339B6449
MGKFRGWHILAGIAALVLTGILGTAMGLNYTAAFMAGCVAFVAVALWTDSRIGRRRREAAREAARASASETAQPSSEPALRDGHKPQGS